MGSLYWIILATHIVTVVFALKLFNIILPSNIIDCYSWIANFILFVFITYYTFYFTKKKFLNSKVHSDGKAVFITGSGSGFGKELAKRLDSEGFYVFASTLHPDSESARDLKKSTSGRLRLFGMDVTSDDSVCKAVQYVKDNLGESELWALVNNAGFYHGTSAEFCSMDDYKKMMDVNGFGPVRVSKAFLPLLRRSKGRIINVTSIVVRMTAHQTAAYAMGKCAHLAFNDSLRQEMDAWGVRVISVEPEIFKTSFVDHNKMMNSMDDIFGRMDPSVKADYGEKFIEELKVFTTSYLKFASPKVNMVTNALMSAIVLEEPDITYTPCRNELYRISLRIIFHFPERWQDLIVKIVSYAMNFPRIKPKRNQ